jgi:hypothetical protein
MRELPKNFAWMMEVLLMVVSIVAVIFCLEIKEASSVLMEF